MGFTSAWGISAHEDALIAELAPRLLPAIEAERADPESRRRWDRWRRFPLPDHRLWYAGYGDEFGSPEERGLRSFRELTSAGERVTEACCDADDGFRVLDLWDRQPDPGLRYVSVHVKEYAVGAFFHAIGPERAAALPGWCGNFLLTAAEVRLVLPGVERALAFTPDERAAVDAQDWLDHADEGAVDGVLGVWRRAAAAGLGLCGVAVHL